MSESEAVSAVVLAPHAPRAVFVFAHGAGAGMNHAFMESMARELATRSVATLRFQFPYAERGLKRPDAPAVAHATIRAATAEAARRFSGTPLFAGGKSFGGRMTSQAQAGMPLAEVVGLVFVGFPLHPAGKPSTQRAEHLAHVRIPMLFLQGTRDALADPGLIRSVVAGLGDRATLKVFENADHSFHVPRKGGSSDTDVQQALVDATVEWMSVASGRR